GASGTQNAPYTVSLSVTSSPTGTFQINSGGPAAGTWLADEDFSGGNTRSTGGTINTNGGRNPGAGAGDQKDGWGGLDFQIPNLTPGGSYEVRLHFAEIYWAAPGLRLFNVAINGATVLSNFDIFATAGGRNIALVEQFTTAADGNGNITIAYEQGAADNPKSSGVEIIPLGSTSPDFSVSAVPSTQSTAAGGSATYTATVGSFGGFSGPVGLSVS